MTGGDIERWTRLHNHKRTKAHVPFRIKRSIEGKSMANVCRRGTILTGEVVRLRGECADSIRVASRIIKHVRARQRNVFVNLAIDKDDQLVLIV